MKARQEAVRPFCYRRGHNLASRVALVFIVMFNYIMIAIEGLLIAQNDTVDRSLVVLLDEGVRWQEFFGSLCNCTS